MAAWLPAGRPSALAVEAAAMSGAGFVAVLLGESPSAWAAALPPAAAAALLSGVITGWANMLLMRLSRAAQSSAGHSLQEQCPVTAQLTWVALQTGCLLGSVVSFVR